MWYYSVNETQQGPVDAAVIGSLVANGTINASTFVWRDGLPNWQPLGQSELAGFLTSPTSAPMQTGGFQQQPQPYNTLQQAAIGGYPQRTPAPERTWMHKLFSFEGRIPRRTYWAGIGIWIGLLFAFSLIGGVIGAMIGNENIGGILILLLLIPYMWSVIVMQIKRWHDRGKSGFMIFVNFIPFVGGIWAFVECGCLRGTEGDNMYGPDPT
jgi:uncharacterized membrane protein YhaH (DUF805 family)